MSIIFGLMILGIFILLIKLIQKIKQKNIKKSIMFIIFLFGAVSFVLVMHIAYNFIFFFCTRANQPYFGTNIFTGECGYFYSLECYHKLWYHKYGCSEEEMRDAFKNYCISICDKFEEKSQYSKYRSIEYCSPRFIPFNTSCQSIANCTKIEC